MENHHNYRYFIEITKNEKGQAWRRTSHQSDIMGKILEHSLNSAAVTPQKLLYRNDLQLSHIAFPALAHSQL